MIVVMVQAVVVVLELVLAVDAVMVLLVREVCGGHGGRDKSVIDEVGGGGSVHEDG